MTPKNTKRLIEDLGYLGIFLIISLVLMLNIFDMFFEGIKR